MSHDDEAPAPDVVDFDALHAALGDLPPPPTSSSPSVGESQGRSSATYSSARPHTIPPTRAPVADELSAPPVIVQTEDTVPSGPPQQMTVPMAGAPPFGGPGTPAPLGAAVARPPSPAHGFTPEPFAASAAAQTGPAPEARTVPLAAPRRPRTPTIVVRSRGPTKQQKLLVFMAMLLVFVGGGIAFLVYGKQLGIDIDLELKQPPPPRTTAVTPAAPPVTATAVPTATATVTATASAAPAATPSTLPVASTSTPAPAPAPSGKKAPRRAAPQAPPSPAP